MARRRMIDPNIWSSEDMSKLNYRQRLLVIGLFSNADDEGKGKAKSAYIRSTIFPYDDIPLPEIIDDMETIRSVISIQFYEVEGNSYYKFLNWSKWQRVDKPQPSIIPEPVENDSKNDSGVNPDPFLPKGKEKNLKEDNSKSDSDYNLHEERLRKVVTSCNIKGAGIDGLETVFSYIGQADLEVIEKALKKAEGKHINYFVEIINGWIAEGKTTKESIQHLQIVHPTQPKEPFKEKEVEPYFRPVG